MLNKELVKSFYLQGYNAVEIAKKVCSNTEAVRKCIQRNFGNLKLKHEIAVIQRKEELKATNYESNRYISDRAFILKNRSIYKTLPNGDIVINREVAPIITWDTPRRLVNENKCLI
ncbi:MAG: DNA-binding response regulator [Clostridium celatum]|nr:DNA-binding response regulator [Clostridium celatum]